MLNIYLETKDSGQVDTTKLIDTNIKVLVFRLGEHEHAVDIRLVKEILINTVITPVAEAPDFVEGVIYHRGRIVPVIDLGKRLHLPALVKTFETCIIVVKFSNKTIGFVVDSASELINLKAEQIEEPSTFVRGIHADFMWGIVYLGERLLVLLDLDEVLTASELDILEQKQNEL
jgi:purine-binding chemotaxis protein CheW